MTEDENIALAAKQIKQGFYIGVGFIFALIVGSTLWGWWDLAWSWVF